jgi:hypothetical protein
MSEGQHLDVKNRRAHIKRYKITEIESRKQLNESRRRFKQAMEALEVWPKSSRFWGIGSTLLNSLK